MRALAVLAFAAVLASCNPPPLAIPKGCSPLLFDHDCGLPYPSDFFLVDDPSLPSGKRVHFDDAAKLLTAHGASADVNDVWPADGFSRITPIVATFGVAVDQSSLPAIFDDAAKTTQKGFHTALIDASTGERVPHFIDVDPLADSPKRQAIVIHPLTLLKEKTRYVVALSGVTSGGKLIEAPQAFARIRDGDTGGDAVLDPLRARFEKDMFGVVDIKRGDLQLAWDFTTGSDERALGDILSSRAVGLQALATTKPVVHVDTVIEGTDLAAVLSDKPDDTFRLIRGTITGPRVVESDSPGALLHRDGSEVALNGTTTFPFTAIIPASVTSKAPVLCFGHGFFGSRKEIESAPPREIANHAGVVAIAIDWQGMSTDDLGVVISTVGGDVSKSLQFGDRVMQSMVNWSAVTDAIKIGVLSADPAFAGFVDDSAPISYLGISQGHVLGGVMNALNPDIEHVTLQVGGAGWTTMMFRARPFSSFLGIMQISIPDALDRQKLAAQLQSQFDRFEPALLARYVLNEDLPKGPTNNHAQKHLLQMMGKGDDEVPNIASELDARLLGIPLLTPSPIPSVFALKSAPFPASSGLSIYDVGVSDDFEKTAEPAPGDGNIVHEGIRRLPQAMDQMKRFFADGTIIDPCDGACVVDTTGLSIPQG